MIKNDQILCVSSAEACEFLRRAFPDKKGLEIKWKKKVPTSIKQSYPILIVEVTPAAGNLNAIRDLSRLHSSSEIFAFSFRGSARIAVESIRNGARDFFSLPDEVESLKKSVFQFLQAETRRARSEEFLNRERSRYDFSKIIGESPRLMEVLDVAEKVIKTRMSPVLIRGETGTGKGLLARAIHYNSVLPEESFVEINCSAIPDTLLESELFGFERGAFTGAVSRKEGLFEVANEGTIFLDEIGHLNPSLQVKLLDAIEYKTIRHLGGTKNIPINPRIIAATSVDLERAMKENNFRRDMYYRLSVVSLTLPPLRERGDDVLLLARHFLREFTGEYGTGSKRFSPRAEKALRAHSWPGNIRELRNTIERAVILSEGKTIRDTDLQFDESGEPGLKTARDESELVIPISDDGISKDEVEKILVRKILTLAGWNKSKASRMLGVTRPTLVSMMKRYGLERESTSNGSAG
ncbi:MAG: sigma-54 interaction domain-containing protein [Candidatus Glassbacteria bacterium]